MFRVVPADERPLRAEIARLRLVSGVGRYWVAPWRGPKSRAGGFCLYTEAPGAPGPTAGCFDAATYRTGRAFAYSVASRHFKLVGFLPGRDSRAELVHGSHVDSLEQRQGVYSAALATVPTALVIYSGDRNYRFELAAPMAKAKAAPSGKPNDRSE